MSIIADIMAVLERLAPLHLAESWDNVGLLVGDPEAEAGRALLTIDLTEPVLEEAIAKEVDLVVAYHPPIFSPLKSLTTADWKSRVILRAAAAGIGVYSPHTALDAAPGGVNDWLARAIAPDVESDDVSPLVVSDGNRGRPNYKLITFIPPQHLDALRQGLAAVGVGQIGDYSECTFVTLGTGTFRPGKGANPAIGKRGSLAQVEEMRYESIIPRPGARQLAAVIDTLRRVHPYEEPAFDLYPLTDEPRSDTGMGRLVTLKRGRSLGQIVEQTKNHLGIDTVRVARAIGERGRHTRAAVCAGAGGSFLDEAIGRDCSVFLTGEMRHHDVVDAQHRGCSVILAGHTNTERGYLPTLRKHIERHLPGVKGYISRKDRYPAPMR